MRFLIIYQILYNHQLPTGIINFRVENLKEKELKFSNFNNGELIDF